MFPPFLCVKSSPFFSPKKNVQLEMSQLMFQVGLAAGQDLPDPEEHGLPGHLLLDVRAPGADAGGGQDQGGTCQRPGGSREAERLLG